MNDISLFEMLNYIFDNCIVEVDENNLESFNIKDSLILCDRKINIEYSYEIIDGKFLDFSIFVFKDNETIEVFRNGIHKILQIQDFYYNLKKKQIENVLKNTNKNKKVIL